MRVRMYISAFFTALMLVMAGCNQEEAVTYPTIDTTGPIAIPDTITTVFDETGDKVVLDFVNGNVRFPVASESGKYIVTSYEYVPDDIIRVWYLDPETGEDRAVERNFGVPNSDPNDTYAFH